ncbi:MAG TPA: pantoate--beta-alanine ligase, partial [Bacteroidetes bacterium]|nr:pantoate--beta-alanine ligase [Bacteroidota bacterium]
VVSIYVNPTQFGPNEDFETYPRDEERDLRLCGERGVDVVWLPASAEMYPPGYDSFVEVERLGETLCGASRPGHFRGVCTIVAKLFNVVRPHVAVFGRKDAQQARIIRQMSEDLHLGVRIVVAPIVREEDGLALSSRNVRLAPEHRAQAPALFRALSAARRAFDEGERDPGRLVAQVRRMLEEQAPDGEIDYIELVSWETMHPVQRADESCLLALAVRFGGVRLIDNIFFSDGEP